MPASNFDFLRLFLAVLVVRCHAGLVGFQLSGTEDGFFLGGRSAVECFFVISGYLIFKSWESWPHLLNYSEKRARRILPAYIFVVVICAVGLSLVSTLSASKYFTHLEFLKYIGSHLVFLGFLQNTLPSVFADHVQPYVNGPLWTIKIEVMFYACVPLIATIANRVSRGLLYLAIYVASIAWQLAFEHLAVAQNREGFNTLVHQLPGQMAFFMVGGAIHYYHDVFVRNVNKLLAVSVVVLVIQFTCDLKGLYPAALAVAVLYVAICLPCFGNFARFGGFSYGIYIYHYPILQVLASLNLPVPVWAVFAIGSFLSFLAAVLSWRFLESRWLHRSSHYIQAQAGRSAKHSLEGWRLEMLIRQSKSIQNRVSAWAG